MTTISLPMGVLPMKQIKWGSLVMSIGVLGVLVLPTNLGMWVGVLIYAAGMLTCLDWLMKRWPR